MLGARLKAAREALGLTQFEAGRLAKLERNTVVRYELGHREPPLRSLRALAQVYGRPIEWFLAEGEPEPVDWSRLGGTLGLEGRGSLELSGTPVFRAGFNNVVGGLSLDFVAVALVASLADAGHEGFDDTVVGLVPFNQAFFDSTSLEPSCCNVVCVGDGPVRGVFRPGSALLVDRSVTAFVEAECHLVRRWDGLVVRRVFSRGGWECYQEGDGWEQVRPGDRVVGVVRWVGRSL